MNRFHRVVGMIAVVTSIIIAMLGMGATMAFADPKAFTPLGDPVYHSALKCQETMREGFAHQTEHGTSCSPVCEVFPNTEAPGTYRHRVVGCRQ